MGRIHLGVKTQLRFRRRYLITAGAIVTEMICGCANFYESVAIRILRRIEGMAVLANLLFDRWEEGGGVLLRENDRMILFNMFVSEGKHRLSGQ